MPVHPESVFSKPGLSNHQDTPIRIVLLPRKAAIPFLLGALPTGSFLDADSWAYHVLAGRKLPLLPRETLNTCIWMLRRNLRRILGPARM
jgi:hypothetical protein